MENENNLKIKKMYAVTVKMKEETEVVHFDKLEDAVYFRDKVLSAKLIYHAHTEKKGYNTHIVLDSPVYKDGHVI